MYYYEPSAFHVFEKNGKYFLYMVRSLAVFELNPISYKMLTSSPPLDPETFAKENRMESLSDEIRETVKSLVQWGLLSTEPPEPIPVQRVPNPFVAEVRVRGLYLGVAQDCNLRCKYCSADYGRFGQDVKVRYMHKEIARKALDLLLSTPRPASEVVRIIFVGGEPLMNFEIIKFVVDYLKTKSSIKTNFFLNSNGTLMTRNKAKWFVENGIPVRLSIDGTAHTHDIDRVYPDGRGSYDEVMKGLKNYLLFEKEGFSVQAAIPHGESLKEAVHALWNLGANLVLANYAAETAFTKGGEFAMTESDFAEFVREWEELGGEITDNLIRNGKSPTMLAFHQFLKWIHSRVGRKPGCGVGSVPCVQPDGNIYLCQGFVGCDEGRVGTVDTGLDHAKVEQFGEMYSDFLAKCDACWARNCCGVACIAQAVQNKTIGDEYEPSVNCGVAKKMIEWVIYSYSQLSEKRPEVLSNAFGSNKPLRVNTVWHPHSD